MRVYELRRLGCLLVACLVAAALAAGCGGDKDSKKSGGSSRSLTGGNVFGGGGDCKDADAALTKAARDHPAPLKVGPGEGDAKRITVEVCRTTDSDATAIVTAYGLRDDSIRDVRHELRLIKSGGLWQVTDDQDSHRCQKGRGPQQFTGYGCQ